MKRSTIILIIFLVLLIITPIVIVKTVNKLSPESKLKGIQTLWNKSDPNTPTRYIITEEYFGSDSIGTTINITTDADSESTLIWGVIRSGFLRVGGNEAKSVYL